MDVLVGSIHPLLAEWHPIFDFAGAKSKNFLSPAVPYGGVTVYRR